MGISSILEQLRQENRLPSPEKSRTARFAIHVDDDCQSGTNETGNKVEDVGSSKSALRDVEGNAITLSVDSADIASAQHAHLETRNFLGNPNMPGRGLKIVPKASSEAPLSGSPPTPESVWRERAKIRRQRNAIPIIAPPCVPRTNSGNTSNNEGGLKDPGSALQETKRNMDTPAFNDIKISSQISRSEAHEMSDHSTTRLHAPVSMSKKAKKRRRDKEQRRMVAAAAEAMGRLDNIALGLGNGSNEVASLPITPSLDDLQCALHTSSATEHEVGTCNDEQPGMTELRQAILELDASKQRLYLTEQKLAENTAAYEKLSNDKILAWDVINNSAHELQCHDEHIPGECKVANDASRLISPVSYTDKIINALHSEPTQNSVAEFESLRRQSTAAYEEGLRVRSKLAGERLAHEKLEKTFNHLWKTILQQNANLELTKVTAECETLKQKLRSQEECKEALARVTAECEDLRKGLRLEDNFISPNAALNSYFRVHSDAALYLGRLNSRTRSYYKTFKEIYRVQPELVKFHRNCMLLLCVINWRGIVFRYYRTNPWRKSFLMMFDKDFSGLKVGAKRDDEWLDYLNQEVYRDGIVAARFAHLKRVYEAAMEAQKSIPNISFY